jgi:peptide/nickel transport system substrate-binding protein
MALRIIALTVSLLACIGAAGCGSSGEKKGPSASILRATFAEFPDYLDPALASSLEGLTAMWETYVPLLTYEHAGGTRGTKVIPGLARSMPKITDGGRAYTLYLRPGLRFSDGSAVRASDFRATIERTLAMNSPGAPFYTDIVGAERFSRTKKGRIAGIRTDDSTGRIVIHLVRPRSTFINELAMLYSAPLPAGTRRADLSADPPPGTGPYVITSSKPGRSWQYGRNPEWASNNAKLLPQVPSGHFDAIDVSVIANAETAVNEVEAGRLDWMQEPPPPDRYEELRKRYEATQLRVTPRVDTYYFWMNVKKAPFDDVRVRRAVNYAIDPAALDRIYGGQMRAMQQVLPQEMPGHRSFRLYPHDMAKALELMAEADPAERKVTVWTDAYPTNRQAGEYYEGVLRELGLEPTLKVLASANYFTVISNSSTPDLDTGWANWFMDYPHPNDFFETQLSSEGIRATAATNWARFEEPAIDRTIEKLGRQRLGPRQEAAYAQLDRRVMAQAPWAPFGSLTLPTFVSSSIDLKKLVVNPVFGPDLATFAPR